MEKKLLITLATAKIPYAKQKLVIYPEMITVKSKPLRENKRRML